MSENYYNILDVKENATFDEIKKAYRKLQMKYHPDRNPGDQTANIMTQKINEAYEVLRDNKKRNEYDMMKNNTFMRMNSRGPHNMTSSHNMNNIDIPINDIFNMMFNSLDPNEMFNMPNTTKIHVFNGGGPINFQKTINKPIPIIKTIHVSMEHVFNGISLPIEIERWILENGIKIFEKETIYVEIPQGVDDNEIIILRNKGNILADDCYGDIKIIVNVENNTEFKRSGLDLILNKQIKLKESLCGFSFELKHINGKTYTLNNNKGSIVPPQYKKIYTGMGLKRGEYKGNLIIHFDVLFPEKLSIEQIDKLIDIFD